MKKETEKKDGALRLKNIYHQKIYKKKSSSPLVVWLVEKSKNKKKKKHLK